MKNKIFIFLSIFIFSCCSIKKDTFSSVENKVYTGKVLEVNYINNKWPFPNHTYIETEYNSLPIYDKRIKVKVGTKCYLYTNPKGTEIFLVWEGCKYVYEID